MVVCLFCWHMQQPTHERDQPLWLPAMRVSFPAQPAPAGGEKGGAGWSSEPGKIMAPCALFMSCWWGTAAWCVVWCVCLLEVIGP